MGSTKLIVIILIILILNLSYGSTTAGDNGDKIEIPQIDSTSPIHNSTNVPIDTEIVIIFNTPMNNTSVEEAFRIYPFVAGTFSWKNNNTIMTYDPIEDLVASDCDLEEYTVTIFAFASDLNQTNLKSDYSFSFTTELLPGMGKISGYVIDLDGNIIKGAKIFIKQYFVVNTSANGYYEHDVANGHSYDVTVQADNHYPITKNSGAICVGSNVSLNFELIPIENETDDESDHLDTINVCYYLGFILIIQIIIIAIMYFSRKKKE
jgi:hypothetical protein